MIAVSRLCRLAYASFDGSGGLYKSGRWHQKSHRTIYAAGSEALAVLEVLVHLSSFSQIPKYVCVKARIDEGLVLDVRELGPLPKDWSSAEPARARELGTRWIEERISPVLRVPSVVVQRESNYMMNPEHPEFTEILVGDPLSFEFDVRLLARLQ